LAGSSALTDLALALNEVRLFSALWALALRVSIAASPSRIWSET
jgi:hypothetical protein